MNTQPDVRKFLPDAIHELEQAGIDEARRNVEWMLEDVLGCNRAALYANMERKLAPEEVEKLQGMLARRKQREPLQYILGHSEFFGLCLTVSPEVLIPRPETEQVVEAALQRIEPVTAPRVLDVGTGSGCIALALKNERPDAEVFACDVSEMALSVARENAFQLNLGINLIHADILLQESQGHLPRDLTLIISNPPYIPEIERESLAPEVKSFEPDQALFCGDDPYVFYRAIVGNLSSHLCPGGWVVFEAHAGYAEEVGTILDHEGFIAVSVKRDLAGHPRIIQAQRPV